MTERLCNYSLRKFAGEQSGLPHLPESGRQMLPYKIYFFVLVLLVAATNAFAQKYLADRPADYVNPFIGTAPPEEKQFLGNNPPPGEELYYGCVSPAAMTVDPVVKLGPNTGFRWHFSCERVFLSLYRHLDHGFYPPAA